jgi:hypothetical protein
MWAHPDATERNITVQFPELFDKHDFLYFSLPDSRMSNFFDSAQFLDASRKTKDLGKLFSAVQRAMQQGEYKGLQAFLKGRDAKTKLAAANTPDAVGKVLDELVEEYNDKYGMGRQVRGFYQEYLDDDGSRLLRTKIPRPASFKPGQYEDEKGRIRVRVDFLLGLRDELSHAATYLPLPEADRVPLHYELRKGDPSSAWLIFLTFDDLYEITRRSMAHLWLQEYETYWDNGGKEVIERVVAEVQAQCDELNKKARGEQKARPLRSNLA